MWCSLQETVNISWEEKDHFVSVNLGPFSIFETKLILLSWRTLVVPLQLYIFTSELMTTSEIYYQEQTEKLQSRPNTSTQIWLGLCWWYDSNIFVYGLHCLTVSWIITKKVLVATRGFPIRIIMTFLDSILIDQRKQKKILKMKHIVLLASVWKICVSLHRDVLLGVLHLQGSIKGLCPDH